MMLHLKWVSKLTPVVRLFERGDKNRLLFIILFTVLCAITEAASLGALMPLIESFVSGEEVQLANTIRSTLPVEGFELSSPATLGILVVLLLMLSLLFRVLLLRTQSYFGASIGNKLTGKLFRSILHKDLATFQEKNTSEFIASSVSRIHTVVVSVLFSGLKLISSTLIIIAASASLLVLSPILTLISIGILVTTYGLIHFIYKPTISKLGFTLSQNQGLVVKALNEGFGSFREIKLSGNFGFFASVVKTSDLRARIANARLQILTTAPKFFVETFFLILMILFAVLAQFLFRDFTEFAANLGVLAFGFQRLLPLGQELFQSIMKIRSGWASLEAVLQDMDSTPIKARPATIDSASFPEFKAITFSEVEFSYSDTNGDNIYVQSLSIKKGERVAIIGDSGSGKTTFLDLLIGFQRPNRGNVSINGSQNRVASASSGLWWPQIALVHQKPFMIDGSLMDNVALGVAPSELDIEKFNLCLTVSGAQSLANRSTENIGENGSFLSGGQKQRVAIARALYKDANILIFDEATNALDQSSERKVIEKIIQAFPEKTIVIVTHSKNVLDFCDFALTIKEGKVTKINMSQAFKECYETKEDSVEVAQ